jgi:hypothetical protein
MPLSLDIDVPDALEKRGFITTLSVTTAASTAGPSIPDKVAAEDDPSLLARLHSAPIFAPPGPCPLLTGACAPTKTQIMAKQKADKDMKAKAVEEKKLLATMHKKEMKAKQQKKLISTAKAKVAKAYSRAKDLRLKLEEAIRASTGVDKKISLLRYGTLSQKE